MGTLVLATQSKWQNGYVRTAISEHSRVHKFDGPSLVEYISSDEQPSQGRLLCCQKPAVPSSDRDDSQQTHGHHTQSAQHDELSQGKWLKEIKCYIWLAVESVVLCLLIPSHGSQTVVKTRQVFCELLNWQAHSSSPWCHTSKFLWGKVVTPHTQPLTWRTRNYTLSGP